MSGLSAFTQIRTRHQTCPVSSPDSRECCWTCLAPIPDMSGSLTPPMGRFPWGLQKASHTSLAHLATQFSLHTLWNTLLSSNSLSLKLHSKLRFLGEIWATFWVTHSTFKQSTSLTIFVCSFLLETCPLDGLGGLGVTKVMVDLKKFVSPSPSWGFDSGIWTRSWWLFGEDYGWKRPCSLWAPQRRRRQPLWLAELQEQILCLLYLLISIYFLYLLKFILVLGWPNPRCDS
jgi:hypothetical protein